MNNILLHRISQFIAFLVGARVFATLLLTFALYVSTFFLFNREESLRNFVFDFRVHGIIFCTVLSVLAGGIINQFYDREKDQFTKPFRTRLQKFLKQKYFLYAYLTLNLVSLGLAYAISPRVFIFFLVYQFFMWFYSHKLSKILVLNNLTFVALTVYPFFGMWVYYRTFSSKVFLMAVFLFILLLICDILKDILTRNADKIFGYVTIANFWGADFSKKIASVLATVLVLISAVIIGREGLHTIMNLYFAVGLFVITAAIVLIWKSKKKFSFYALNVFRFWLFIGIVSMLLDGIIERF